ncbi:hypothetical protein GONAM_15_01590 [Gordonia namibiensis NBRC 108229]|uniref:Uncharacterized protein n=1 Tax=Gordonia namibiensis NBRC 108229 TaxID=1208314 RepID=K6XNP7_9ACTN|nr:hypothetical protein GONAM_15_01590 [Gordonia namibiensis NBRC 108229]
MVNSRGDVKARVGTTSYNWSGAQARAPYALAGPELEKSVRDWTRSQSENLKSAIPGSDVLWPAEQAR